MKIIKYLLFAFLGFIAIVVIAGFMMDSKMEVKKEAVIDAPVEKVYAAVATPKLRSQWDPWLSIDPDAIVKYEGPESGVGAINTWQSENSDLGVGKQEIVEARENEYIRTLVTMDMMEAEINSEFNFTATEDGKTNVVWSMTSESTGMGPLNGIMAWMGEFFVGSSFDLGLMNLKSEINNMEIAAPSTNTNMKDMQITAMEKVNYLGHSSSSETNPDAISKAMGASFGAVMGYMGQNGIEPAGAPVNVVSKWAPEENICEYTAGIPTAEMKDGNGKDIVGSVWGETSDEMASVIHTGDYSTMEGTYGSLMIYIEEQGYEIKGSPIEQYLNDPGETKEEDLLTKISFPVAKKSTDS